MVRAIILILLPVVVRTAFETAEKRPQAIPELRAGLRRVFWAVEEVHRFLVFLISMAIIEKAITTKIPAKMNKPLIQIISIPLRWPALKINSLELASFREALHRRLPECKLDIRVG